MLCGGQAVAHAAGPPLHVGDGSKGTAGPLQFGTSHVAGVARMRLSTRRNCLRDSNSGFSLEVYLLKPFPKKGNCKATVIIARWPPLALQNRRPLTDLVLTSIWVSNHPLITSLARNGGGAGLVADDSTLKQVVLGYRLPEASRLDLTWSSKPNTTGEKPRYLADLTRTNI